MVSSNLQLFLRGPSEINIVQIRDYEEFNNLVGRDRDPAMCEKHTIRYNFGQGKEIINGFEIYKNAIHRTKNYKEYLESIVVFEGLFDL